MTSPTNQPAGGNILALDVGAARIGVAVANEVARLAQPLTFIEHTDDVFDQLQQLITDQHIGTVVIGLPRGLQGQETSQTTAIRAFATEFKSRCPIPVFWQDEAVTSKRAEAELEAKGKPFQKGEVDALAACYILEDFLAETEHQAV